MRFFAEIGKTGLTNAARRGIIYLAFAGVAHLVERDLAKVEVASSSLVARSKKNTPSDRMGYSFWNAAGRMGHAASTSAKRVKSRGEGRAPANGSAIRGMPGSEFEPRLFCCAEREKQRNTIRQDGVSFWNAAGRMELAASTSAHQRTDCCWISRRAACPQAAAVYRRCPRLPRGGVRAPRPMHERVKPFRRGRRPRRPVSAAVPRWERIPTSLRAAKQVPLG